MLIDSHAESACDGSEVKAVPDRTQKRNRNGKNKLPFDTNRRAGRLNSPLLLCKKNERKKKHVRCWLRQTGGIHFYASTAVIDFELFMSILTANFVSPAIYEDTCIRTGKCLRESKAINMPMKVIRLIY